MWILCCYKFSINFNWKKGQLMVCGSPSFQPRVQGNNESVKVVDNMQYLGHPVTNNRQNPLVEETTKDFTWTWTWTGFHHISIRVCFLSCTAQVFMVHRYVLYVMELLRFLILHIGRPLGGYGGSRIEPVESYCHTFCVSMYALIILKQNKCIIIANTQKTPYRGQKSSGKKS